MEFCYFLIAFFILIILIAACIVAIIAFSAFKNIDKRKQGLINYDSCMRKFVFRVDLTKEEVYERLRTRNVTDVLEYILNEDLSVITFKCYKGEISYIFSVCEYDNNDYLIIRLEQLLLIPGKSRILKNINKFFFMKLDAKILDYDKYSF